MKKLPVLLCTVLPLIAGAPSVDKGKAFGNPAAPITIELFSDFQCPACQALHRDLLPSIMRDYVVPGKAYLVYKEFPLPMHNHSREAAAYACAAARVGKYEQVADVLFQNQSSWAASGKVFETVSTALSPAEQKKVQTLAKDPAVLNEVQEDVQEGQSIPVNQTPTMIIIHGAKRYPIAGGLNYNLLRTFLDQMLK
ncbi:MAG: thioredoxin domain-containing protein [Acidobacteriia bacterium]|nr:thioredoxin domain-containing protein [Terriglobia bacterium]MBV8906221.1 thioredoxin domain-containing protein [Terriglobia bacterium]MBV9744557.1 thioredoxin domain-containing protein [Terriglobia bacterium]